MNLKKKEKRSKQKNFIACMSAGIGFGLFRHGVLCLGTYDQLTRSNCTSFNTLWNSLANHRTFHALFYPIRSSSDVFGSCRLLEVTASSCKGIHVECTLMEHNPRGYQLLLTGTMLIQIRIADFGFETFISMVSTIIMIGLWGSWF